MTLVRRVSGTLRLPVIAFSLAFFVILLFPAGVSAHAILLRSDPAQDAVLMTPPAQVHMWFSENLNPTFSTAYVVNAANSTASTVTDTTTHVDTGNAHVSANDPKEMDLSLKSSLAPAVYAVHWRTQSADDGHILSGSFLFTIAEPNGTVPKLNGSQAGQGSFSGGGASTGQFDGPTLLSFIAVTLVDLGVVFWVAAQLWLTFVLQLSETDQQEEQAIYQRVERRFERIFSAPTLLLLLLANVGVLLGQALVLTGGQWGQALSPAILSGLIVGGNFGTYWTMREVVIVLALMIAISKLLSEERPAIVNSLIPWANLILGLALLISVTLSGHAAAVNSDILVYSVLVDWLHLLAAALWVGGMMYIATSYLPVLHEQSPMTRTRSLLATLPHYSPLAITGVIIMTLTGPFNAVVHISTWEQLLTTAYGRALVIKILLVGGLLLTSAIHVGILRPRLAKDYKKYMALLDGVQSEEAAEAEHPTNFTAQQVKTLEGQVSKQTTRLTTVLRWEPLLGIAVLVCTGLMNVFAGTLLPATTTQPTGTSQQQTVPALPSKPFSTTVKTADNKFTVKLAISPNSVGTNVFTVHVLNSSGATETNIGVSLYTTMLDMDMGTDSLNLQPDGKGNFTGSGDFSMGGNYQLRVQIRTPDNALHETKLKFFTPY